MAPTWVTQTGKIFPVIFAIAQYLEDLESQLSCVKTSLASFRQKFSGSVFASILESLSFGAFFVPLKQLFVLVLPKLPADFIFCLKTLASSEL